MVIFLNKHKLYITFFIMNSLFNQLIDVNTFPPFALGSKMPFVQVRSDNLATNVSGSEHTEGLPLTTNSAGATDTIYLAGLLFRVRVDNTQEKYEGWGSSTTPLTNGFYIYYTQDGIQRQLIGHSSDRVKNFGQLHLHMRTHARRNANGKIVHQWDLKWPVPVKWAGTDTIKIVRGGDDYSGGDTALMDITAQVYDKY